MKRHLFGLFIGLITLIIGAIGYSYGAYYNGKLEAHFDLIRGKHIIRTYGTPAAGRDKYAGFWLRSMA